ncbi:MAG TPA: hypothetical protein VGG74_28085 [Kofleriaceae bacterium]|jgi:hypothetical protein
MKWALLIVVCVAWIGCDKDKSSGSGSGSASVAAAGSAAAGSAESDDDEGSAAVKPWNVGDVVQVKRDGKWHEAEIVTAGSGYKVLYTFDDQVEEAVPATRIRAEKWSKKTHVEAQVGDAWKRGTVAARHGEAPSYTYDIALDDSGETKTFPAAQVRGLRKPKSAAHASAASSGGGGGGPAPCTGPAYMRRCGGTCVDTQQDNNNCGACGSRCASNKHCDGHGFCREANGDL